MVSVVFRQVVAENQLRCWSDVVGYKCDRRPVNDRGSFFRSEHDLQQCINGVFLCIVLLIYWRGIRNNVRWTLNGGGMLVECWVNEWCVQPSFENTIFGDLITSGWLANPHTNRNRRCPIDFPLPCLIWKAMYLKILEENRLFQSLYHPDH